MDHLHPTVAPLDKVAETDRRDGLRLRAVCRIAKIVRVDDAGLWMVRNISDGGMMLTTSVPVAMGENITVILAERLALNGHVIWVRDGQCGIAFDDEIDGEAILRQLAEDKAARGYRPFRIALKAGALASFNHRMQPIELVNLSQHGAGIVHDGSVTTGMRLDLLLSGGIRREAIVRWSRECQAGLWLTQPLERALLESIRALHAVPQETAAPPKANKGKRQKSCASRP
jgi:PilZ domain